MNRSASFLALLTLSSLGHALSGQVQDANGKPLAGATIELLGSQQTATTDSLGNFKLNVDDSQVDEVHINAPGYSHETLHLHGEHRGTLTVKLYRSVIEQVDVTAVPLHISVMESAQPVTVVAGEDLRRKQASTLGETLKNEVGVHSSYFGPVASSPIIRGLNGPRVLITQNGLDVSDASRVGPDHVVSTEASTAEQIEILRGPATLFYGSGAIGGVINIVDDRVPSSSEERGAFAIGHNSVADENEASFAYTGGTEQFAVHIDGFKRDGNNYEIPGAAALEEEHDHEDEHEEEHEEGRDGVLENSASESKGFNIGGSWLLDNGYVGLSYGRLERLNGIPGHSHAHEEEEHEGEEEHEEHEEDVAVQSDLVQDRWQLISELSLDTPLLSGINTRIGYTDYEHKEIEGGEVGTIFRNETLQARVDLLMQEMAGWRGAVSVEVTHSDFEAIGEEAFTPPAKTESYAIALMEEKHIGDVLVQLGARVEQVSIKADPIEWEDHHAEDEADSHTLQHFDDMEFTPISLSAGLVWEFTPGYNAGISLTHAQRAPSAAELFSYGPHIGSGAFEVGAVFDLHAGDHPHFHYHDDVTEEVSNNIDLSLRKHAGNIAWVLNFFYNEIDDFYYQQSTGYSSGDISGHDHEEEAGGEEEHEHGHDDFPVYVFQQADATLYGVEAQLAWQLASPLKLTLMADTTRGKLKDGGNLPRIPPARLGGELRYALNGWNAAFGMSRYFEQDRVAELETTTGAYTLMDAELAYTFAGLGDTRNGDVTVYVKGSNLSDEEARVHSSFLKDQAPLPGRNISIGLRGSF